MLTGLLTGIVLIVFQRMEFLVLSKRLSLDLVLTLATTGALTLGFRIAKLVITAAPTSESTSGELATLTARETEIFLLIYNGKTNKEIASTYFVEVSTIKTHINNLYSKLGVSNRREAQEKYKKRVLTSSPPFLHPC